MRVLLFEYITASTSPEHPLWTEGRAMREAIASDLRSIPGVEMLESSLDEFDQAVTRSDGCLIIAPETDGILEQLTRRVEAKGRVNYGSGSSAIAKTSDKWQTHQCWQQAGLTTPRTVCLPQFQHDFPFPAIIKPRDGAGSTDTRIIRGEADLAHWRSVYESFSDRFLIQQFCPGIPVSVALIGEPALTPLLACSQLLSHDGLCTYLGGSAPLPEPWQSRAVDLAQRALIATGETFRGYVGVDLILGESTDWAIEINPRLTTSYLGLRELSRINLAKIILRMRDSRDLSWNYQPLRWYSDGRTERTDNCLFRFHRDVF